MKKKAFTLTELLVVVVIIGVLAAVVLPKFTQVLETRRTTEAEEIMRAVRSEQEARCTLDKNYVGEVDKAELASFPANEGNNYHYTLTATGIAAASRNKNYTLRIPSYRDGEICCDGDDCAHLGKTYPVCPARVVAVDECAAETACNLRSYSEACPSGQEGQVLFVPNADCTGYEQVNQCHDITVDPTTCSEGDTRHVNHNCAGSSGERCEGGVWKPFTSTDDGTPQPGNTTKTCPTGDTVTCTYTCNDTTGVWEPKCGECPTCTEGATRNVNSNCAGSSGERCEGGTWKPFTSTDDGTPQPGDTTKTCSTGASVTCTYECNATTGVWEQKCGECPTCPQPTHGGQTTYTEPCPEKDGFKLQAGSVYYTWDDQACNYAKDDRCNYTDCTPTHNGQETWQDGCPAPQVGSIFYQWNYDKCEYETTNSNCSGSGQNPVWHSTSQQTTTERIYEVGYYNIQSCADACRVANDQYQQFNLTWPQMCGAGEYAGASCSPGRIGGQCTAERHAECYHYGQSCCNDTTSLVNTGLHSVSCVITGHVLKCQ